MAVSSWENHLYMGHLYHGQEVSMELPSLKHPPPRHPDVPPLPCGVPWAVQQSHVLEEGTGYDGGSCHTLGIIIYNIYPLVI